MSNFICPPEIPGNYVVCFNSTYAPKSLPEAEQILKDDIAKTQILKSYYGAQKYDLALQDLKQIENNMLV